MSILDDHHIIPERFRNHQAFRGIDKQTFDIDSPANRIYLPGDRAVAAELNAPPHPSRHTSSYIKAVCKRLNEIAEIESPSNRMAEINTLIDAMRVGFANGDLNTNVPFDKTRDEVDRGIAKVLTNDKAYIGQHPVRLRAIRDLQQRGVDAGLDHLIKWLLYLDDPQKQKQLDEIIKRNPEVNITAGNKDLQGTPWGPKFATLDPSLNNLRIPGSTPVDPADFPPPSGSTLPSLGALSGTEGFTRSDPRFSSGIPAFPALGGDERRLGQLPPSTAVPPEPQELQFHSETSDLLRFTDGSPTLGPNPYKMRSDQNDGPAVLGGLAIFAAAMAVPALMPLLPVLLPMATLGLIGATAASAKPTGNAGERETISEAPSLHPFDPAQDALNIDGHPFGARSAAAQVPNGSFDQGPMRAGTFADRFGSWADTPAGAVPAPNGQEVSVPPAAEAAAPQDVRRLTRLNTSNAGSVFTSGSAPVPYLPSTEFNDRFGNWITSTASGWPSQASKPIGPLGDEPSYIIPPPIFGVDGTGNPRNDGEEWFSRWIRPLLPPE
ncbi:hypothetical protein PMI42_00571 [Bradyrhizobium sp. YR681]|uniref:AHH domain-containing protein n=1 Tax=Bradyrhizobium sp. YR681 TaxID=1144344 RepID=UPI0002714826|nr:AHH domain-containing protein [Bradyrhizobium sp. YR681]EJN15806.1 hypothetical protein PMI42_00571 [Bradyrhizobium sp. YR681]